MLAMKKFKPVRQLARIYPESMAIGSVVAEWLGRRAGGRGRQIPISLEEGFPGRLSGPTPACANQDWGGGDQSYLEWSTPVRIAGKWGSQPSTPHPWLTSVFHVTSSVLLPGSGIWRLWRSVATGASGFIGGEILYNLVKYHPEYTIRALFRDSKKAQSLTGVFANTQVVEGSLDDDVVLTKEAAEADIIVHAAATGHLRSVQTIHEALKKRPADGRPVYWIQVSGATAVSAAELADKSRIPGSPSDAIWDDLDGVADIRDMIQKHPSRAVDDYMLSVAQDTPQVNTAILFPPIIFGTGHGPINQRSIQIPRLAKATLERKTGLVVGKGENRWGSVHIRDLGRLVLKLVERATEPGQYDEQLWNDNGLYMLGLEETTFRHLSERVAELAVGKGFIPSAAGIDQVLGDEANMLLPHATVIYGTNARSRARRGQEVLGWKPEHVPGLEQGIVEAVDVEAKLLGLA
ncbi:hypothetical protein Purlil1_1665 [Purpureocillium lilacinum]|uniref:NAD(P)-binding domain-containing protein n=1 Tax=Purpureocillium lilacinum TaxID=33203 RepID=A0ABR0CCY7_PURLI|nr:hypothetical protein Purlil1_1665 [Purpureocillium lilacinum]